MIGFMGAGKTSVGRVVGQQLGWTFEDLDERIALRENRTVAEIFRDSGESGFRRAEHEALKELLGELCAGTGKIVALGGGAFVQKHNARLIEAEGLPAVFLDAGAEELWRRCRKQATQQGIERPLLGNEKSFIDLYKTRRPNYLKASFRLDTGGKTVEEIAAEVIRTLGLVTSRRQGEQQ